MRQTTTAMPTTITAAAAAARRSDFLARADRDRLVRAALTSPARPGRSIWPHRRAAAAPGFRGWLRRLRSKGAELA